MRDSLPLLACDEIDPIEKFHLFRCGYRSIGDLRNISAIHLSKQLNVKTSICEEILSKTRNSEVSESINSLGIRNRINKVLQSSLNISTCMMGRNLNKRTNANAVTALDILRNMYTVKSPENEIGAKTSEENPKIIVQSKRCIKSLSNSINSLFMENGIPSGRITEFCGAPGVGKTQTCLQLTICSLFEELGGSNDGVAIFIDTEGSFDAARALEISNEVLEHISTLRSTILSETKPKIPTAESLLSRILYFRIFDHYELIALIYQMPTFISNTLEKTNSDKSTNTIPFICIDGIAAHFRQSFGYDTITRAKYLHLIAVEVRKFTQRFNICTVITNQMATKYGVDLSIPINHNSISEASTTSLKKGNSNTSILEQNNGGDIPVEFELPSSADKNTTINNKGSNDEEEDLDNLNTGSVLVPALGDTWTHGINNRVILYWNTNTRNAVLIKSSNAPVKNVSYDITLAGLSDIGDDPLNPLELVYDKNARTPPLGKRKRYYPRSPTKQNKTPEKSASILDEVGTPILQPLSQLYTTSQTKNVSSNHDDLSFGDLESYSNDDGEGEKTEEKEEVYSIQKPMEQFDLHMENNNKKLIEDEFEMFSDIDMDSFEGFS